ncbi:hypothetical protein DPEC_G00361300 [Dallia pectoralis]|uniref:Uncharacterized protein n=1 Tax=Dallia pectoralis TaxID=75939 RepID=A0ACC2F158_DALPE|nr:hypothetical protein DPEC_G00361300 [Dallia pectoralis]
MFNCCSHGTLLHFGLQSSRLNICYYHQDLHPRRLHPGPRPRLPCSPRRPSYSSRRSPRGSVAGDGRVGRPICTSGPLRTSTRVSSGFALPRHSSPSFGYHRVRSCSTSPTERARRAGGAPRPGGQGSHLSRRAPALTFIAPRVYESRSLPCGATRSDPHWGQSGPVDSRAGGRGPRAPPRGSMTQRALCPRPRETASRGRGAVKLTAARPVATFAPPFQADPETVAAHRRRKKCARRRNLNPGADPRLGIRTHRGTPSRERGQRRFTTGSRAPRRGNGSDRSGGWAGAHPPRRPGLHLGGRGSLEASHDAPAAESNPPGGG